MPDEMFAIIVFSCLFHFIIEVIYTVPVKTLYNQYALLIFCTFSAITF